MGFVYGFLSGLFRALSFAAGFTAFVIIFHGLGPDDHFARPDDMSPLIYYAGLMLGALVAILTSFGLASASRSMGQRRLDGVTASLAVKAMSGAPTKRFFLYLRPFWTTSLLRFDKRERRIYEMPYWGNRDHDADFEFALREAMAKFGPMIALGRPGEHVGVGRLQTTDENWFEIASVLVDRAALVFCVPGPEEGTLQEIKYILGDDDRRRKSVFLYPPNAVEAFAERWPRIQARLAAEGVRWPDQPTEPIAFILGEDGEIAASHRLLAGDRTELRDCAGLVDKSYKDSSYMRWNSDLERWARTSEDESKKALAEAEARAQRE